MQPDDNMSALAATEITAETMSGELRNEVLPVTIIIVLFAVLGFIGNIVVIIVYSNKYPSCNFRLFVLCIAAIDLVCSLTAIPAEVYTERHWFHFESDWLCRAKTFFNIYTVLPTGLVLLLISIDRYRKVCRPHGWQIRPKVAIILCGIVFAFCLLPASLGAVIRGTQSYVVQDNNVTVTVCRLNPTFKESVLPAMMAGIYLAACAVISITTLVLYSLISVRLFCGPLIIRTSTTFSTSLGQERASEGTSASVRRKETFSATSSPSPNLISNNNNAFVLKESGSSGQSINQSDDISKEFSDCVFDDETGEKSLKANETLKEHIFLFPPPEYSKKSSSNVEEQPVKCRPKKPSKEPFLSDINNTRSLKRRRRSRTFSRTKSYTGPNRSNLQRKTCIMFILTAVYIVTLIGYLALANFLIKKDNLLKSLTYQELALVFFFYRVHFVKGIINPILYGFLDLRFRRALKNLCCCCNWANGHSGTDSVEYRHNPAVN